MANSENNDLESIKVDRQKLIKFQEWCAKNEINYLVIIDKLIDFCLANNQVIIQSLISNKDNISWEEKINLIINKSLKPLMVRIEKLESKLMEKNHNFQNNDTLISSPSLSDLPEKNFSKRVYLSRQEVWQILKKTDYIKYSGYDSFLKVKGDQLVQYGIFFEERKKRFYIVNDD
ncbi:hypothetical protein [Geminocystis sp. NIES-3709]|uniref:hypothetical protein n=1 Tax=Geminocystis sp. NIES-3709 TaxID=1617448 RepID=UPI0005FC6A17|nr:hypothetical protein [Geminocystis sp. NIES-3709]BAQ63323.1 hypothetical protein GM3709_88 [Geminocystis sp. NIES-3709]